LHATRIAPESFEMNIKILSSEAETLADFSVPIRVLPEVKDMKLPESIKLFTWYSFPLRRIDLQQTSGKLPERMLENWINTGFAGGDIIPAAKNIQWQVIRDRTGTFTYYPEVFKEEPGLPRPPYAITAGNTVWERYFCSSAMADMGEKIYERKLKKLLESDPSIADKNVWCVVDYEPYAPIEGWVTKTCFCPLCIKNFSKFSGISDENLDAKTILTKYQNEWVKFRCWQRAQEVAAMAKAFHSINPEGKFLLASMPMPEKGADQQYFKEYGIDLRLYDDFVDIHYPMCYEDSIQFFQRVERCIKELKKPVIPIIGNYNKLLTPSRVGLQTLVCGMLGCKRICYWTGLNMMDGSMMTVIKQAMKKLAKAEQYIVRGQIEEKEVIVTPGFAAKDHLYSVSRKSGRKKAILLVNNNPDQACYACIFLPYQKEGNYSVVNIDDGQLWSIDGKKKTFSEKELKNGFTVKIEPLSDVFIEITPEIKSDARIKYNTDAIKKEEKAKQDFYSSRMQWHKAHGMAAGLKNVDGKHWYAIETPCQRLLIDINDSAIARWELKEKNDWVSLGSSIARDVFVFPVTMWLNNKKVDLSNIDFKNNMTLAEFSYSINDEPFSGLTIKKTYKVNRDNPEISVSIAIIPGGNFRPFVYRAHHIINAGIKQAETTGTPYAQNIEYLIPYREQMIKDGGAGVISSIYIRPDAKFPDNEPYLKKEAKQIKNFDGDWCILRNKITGEKIRAVFGSKVDEIFLWKYGSLATIEWIYQNPNARQDVHLSKTWEIEYRLEYQFPDER